MAFTHLTKPVVGDPTRLDALAGPVIDDLEYLFAGLSTAQGAGILNGSFEQNTGANTAPTSWTMVLPAGNTALIETAALNVRHGAQSFKMTTPGAVAGGVSLTTDFYPIGELQPMTLLWFMMSSVAGIRNQVLVSWYSNLQALISTTSYYDSTANSLVWTENTFTATPPANARFFKVQLLGLNNPTAGSVWWDGVSFRINENAAGMTVITATGAGTWTCPGNVTAIKYRLYSGGGGSARGQANGCAGAGGHKVEGTRAVVPGTVYSTFVGAGGAAGTVASGSLIGSPGGDTWFDTNAIKAAGGLGGTAGGGAPALTAVAPQAFTGAMYGFYNNPATATTGGDGPERVGLAGLPSVGYSAGGSNPAGGADGYAGTGGILIIEPIFA